MVSPNGANKSFSFDTTVEITGNITLSDSHINVLYVIYMYAPKHTDQKALNNRMTFKVIQGHW